MEPIINCKESCFTEKKIPSLTLTLDPSRTVVLYNVLHYNIKYQLEIKVHIYIKCLGSGKLQGSDKRWALGCVNSPPLAGREIKESGFTQPRADLLADPCKQTTATD